MPKTNTVRVSKAHQHILTIRKDKFGIDAQGGLIKTNPLSRDLQNAIRHLSDELYSKDVHFILELIQNAEDNSYLASSEPSLTFRLLDQDQTGTSGAEGCLIIENNETGFSQRNVDALCSLGSSTKTKRDGYIGEKGIGFKSVFKVSDVPHIFSGGYQFCLPKEYEASGLGYIVPKWIDSVPAIVRPSGTTIILPLRKGERAKVEKALRDIAPETILFLTRIRSLEIGIEGQVHFCIVKDESRAPLVRLEYFDFLNNTTPFEWHFWIKSTSCSRPGSVVEEKRSDIFERTVSVALPLSEGDESAGRVFAYLPTEMESDLPFLVNADFLLTSSREAIRADLGWNHWLRDCIASAFVDALDSLVHSGEHASSAYKFIPITEPTAMPEFFAPVPSAIHEGLAVREIVMVEHELGLRIPSHTRVASKGFRTVFSHEPPPSPLRQKYLVKREIQVYEKQLRAIGVKPITTDDVVACLSDLEWVQARTHDWLLECLGYLKQLGNASVNAALKGIPLIIVSSGKYSCPKEQPIYYPASLTLDERSEIEPFESLCPVAFMDAKLADLCQKASEEMQEWLEEVLELYCFDFANYCVDLFSRLRVVWESVPDDVLIGSTLFLSRHCPDSLCLDNLPVLLASGRRALMSSLRSECSGGTVSVSGFSNIVMPESAPSSSAWRSLFPEPGDRVHLHVLSDSYFPEGAEKRDTERIEVLLTRAGASYYPTMRVALSYSWTGNQYEKGLFSNHTEYSTRDKSLVNCRPPRWLNGVLADWAVPSDIDAKALALIKWLEHYVNRFSAIQYAKLSYFYYSSYSSRYDSEFFHLLTHAPWVPSTRGYSVASSVFVDTPGIREVLGDVASYATMPISTQVIKYLGIKTEVRTEDLVNILLRWQSSNTCSKDDVMRIYRALSARDETEVRAAFRRHPLIFFSREKKWRCSGEVIWADRSDVFGELYGYLEREYPKLKAFFTDTLGISEDATVQTYAEAWSRMSGQGNLDPRNIESALTKIYHALLPECRQICRGETLPLWWNAFAGSVKWWTQEKKWCDLSDVYVPDDPLLRKSFGESGVLFVWKPPKDTYAAFAPLFKAFDAHFLSENVQIAIPFDDETCASRISPRYLTRGSKRALLAFLHTERPDDFGRLVSEGIVEALVLTQEMMVEEDLQVELSLNGQYAINAKWPAYWDYPKRRLLVRKHSNNSEDVREETAAALARELADKGFDGCEETVFMILCKNEDDARRLVEKKRWNIPREALALFAGKAQIVNDGAEEDGDNLRVNAETGSPENTGATDVANSQKPSALDAFAVSLPDESSGHQTHRGDKSTGKHDVVTAEKPGRRDSAVEEVDAFEDDSGVSVDREDDCGEGGQKKEGSRTEALGAHSPEDSSGKFSFTEALKQAFVRPARGGRERHIMEDGGTVPDAGRRRNAIISDLNNAVETERDAAERQHKVVVVRWEGKNPDTRSTLLNYYQGKCQICNTTFITREGQPYFEGVYLASHTKAAWVDHPGNVLCLCAEHCARFLHGPVIAPDILEQIQALRTSSEGGSSNPVIRLRICNEELEIVFNERHLIDLQGLIVADSHVKS